MKLIQTHFDPWINLVVYRRLLQCTAFCQCQGSESFLRKVWFLVYFRHRNWPHDDALICHMVFTIQVNVAEKWMWSTRDQR